MVERNAAERGMSMRSISLGYDDVSHRQSSAAVRRGVELQSEIEDLQKQIAQLSLLRDHSVADVSGAVPAEGSPDDLDQVLEPVEYESSSSPPHTVGATAEGVRNEGGEACRAARFDDATGVDCVEMMWPPSPPPAAHTSDEVPAQIAQPALLTRQWLLGVQSRMQRACSSVSMSLSGNERYARCNGALALALRPSDLRDAAPPIPVDPFLDAKLRLWQERCRV